MKPLPIGTKAPDFVLVDQVGRSVRLCDMIERTGALLIFYPSDWGYICHQEMTAFRNMQSELEITGYRPIGISFNDTVSHGLWSERLGLRFPLLSDRTGDVSASYGVLDDKEESFNKGRSERALFMVNKKGRIIWSWEAENLWLEPDYDNVLNIACRSSGSIIEL